jgi:hypothetical protein
MRSRNSSPIRHQNYAILRVFRAFKNRKSKGAKGFKGCHLKIDTVEVRSSSLDARTFRRTLRSICALLARLRLFFTAFGAIRGPASC